MKRRIVSAIINQEEIAPRANRPKCRNCQKPLRAQIVWNWTNREIGPVSRVFTGQYGDNGDNEFCNLRCGYKWGISIVQALKTGEYRLVKASASTATDSV